MTAGDRASGYLGTSLGRGVDSRDRSRPSRSRAPAAL